MFRAHFNIFFFVKVNFFEFQSGTNQSILFIFELLPSFWMNLKEDGYFHFYFAKGKNCVCVCVVNAKTILENCQKKKDGKPLTFSFRVHKF